MTVKSRKVSRSAASNPSQHFLPDNIPDYSEPETEQQTENSIFFENRDSFDHELKSWLSENKYIDSGYITMVYKFDNPHSGETKALIGQWTDYIPSEHEIGLSCGAGRYIILVRVTEPDGKKKLASRKFKIHGNYDNLKQQQDGLKQLLPPGYFLATAGQQTAPGTGNNSDMSGLIMAMGMFEKIIQMILPIVNRPQNDNIAGILADTYKGVNETMRSAMLDNAQLYNDMLRDKLNMDEVVETEEEVSEVQNVINTIAPLLEKFLPVILGQGAKSKATIEGVKALPDYKAIIEDKRKLSALINYIENKEGNETAEKLLKKLKIKRP